MTTTPPRTVARSASDDYLRSRWDDAVAAALDPVARLVYRSNLLGAGPDHEHRRRQHVVEDRRDRPAHRRDRAGAVGQGIGGRPAHGDAREFRVALLGPSIESPGPVRALSAAPAQEPRRGSDCWGVTAHA